MTMGHDPGEGHSIWTPLRLGIASAVFIVVAVLITVLVVRSGDQEAASEPADRAGTTSTPTPTPTSSAPTAGETYESACGLRGGSLQQPTQQPADLTWERVDGWAYPISPSAGPGRRDADGAWSCFARTPTGAVVAAYTINVRLGLASDFDAVARTQTVPGIGQNALLQRGQEEGSAGVTDTKGFVLESYTNDDAVLSFYLVQSGQLYTCSTSVQWRDGDWRVRLETNGDGFSGCVDGAPSRFITWGDQ
ncbi:hypothetical protein [Solicola sp. PLA-1-18]|uniref:hypothetical protein n=1 Tax=Solicola sp. PLA-1-18 TaxID=3380532 RepID=UPI003B7B4F92